MEYERRQQCGLSSMMSKGFADLERSNFVRGERGW